MLSWGQFETPGLVVAMKIVSALRGDSPFGGVTAITRIGLFVLLLLNS